MRRFVVPGVLLGAVLVAGTAVRAAEAPAAKPAARPALPAVSKAEPSRAEGRTVVFFGDSLTAGYGLDEPAAEAFPALIQKKIDAARLPWRVVNAGLSGETSSGGLRRVEWVLRQPVDAFVLALGGNDGLRGIEPAITRANLTRIIARVREKNPSAKIVLAGMQMTPNLGQDYLRDFAVIFPEIAARERVVFVPFLLDGVGGQPELNQPDGIHPNADGHAIVADNIWKNLRPLL